MTVHPLVVTVVSVVALTVIVVLAVLLARARRGQATPRPADEHEGGPRRRGAVVVNPTKFDDLAAVREQVTRGFRLQAWADPLWLETTAEDPGRGQAQQALDEGVDLVCPLGGDGTVRDVAEALVHTGTPLGLLPGGTGNLLARNLGLPYLDLERSIAVALTGTDRVIDVGRVRFDPAPDGAGQDGAGQDGDAQEKVFLVMAGLGFDAAMMRAAPERLKNRVGWLAYAVSGLQNLRGPRARARVQADDAPPFHRRVSSVLVGNCGTLTGGIVLLPEAQVDDGWLDVVTLSPRGLAGWAVVAARLLTRRGHHRIERLRCRELTVRVDRPTEAQLDGDVVGEVRAMTARIDPGALVVRMPLVQA